ELLAEKAEDFRAPFLAEHLRERWSQKTEAIARTLTAETPGQTISMRTRLRRFTCGRVAQIHGEGPIERTRALEQDSKRLLTRPRFFEQTEDGAALVVGQPSSSEALGQRARWKGEKEIVEYSTKDSLVFSRLGKDQREGILDLAPIRQAQRTESAKR